MDCLEVRMGLWPPERPRLASDDVLAAREHVRRCPSCARFFAQDRRLLDAYDRLRREETPAAVKDAVVAAVRDEGTRAHVTTTEARGATSWPRRPAGLLAVLVVAVAGILGSIHLWDAGAGSAVDSAGTSIYTDDYLRRAVGRDQLETNDPTEARRFLRRELGVELEPLSGPGLVLRRVEICLLDGRRAAMIEYRLDGKVVSHYVVPMEEDEARRPSVQEGGSPRAPPVVTWSVGSVEQALVGELSAERLLELAR